MTQMTFDLALIEEDDRPAVVAATRRLHDLERRTGEAIVEIGRTLTDVKTRLGYGRFGQWLKEEFGWTDRTARNFMQVAEVFGDKTEIISEFAPTALIALASGSVPESLRDEFLQIAESGERVKSKDVHKRIAEERRFAVVDMSTGAIVDDEHEEPVEGQIVSETTAPSKSIQHSPKPVSNRNFIEALVDELPLSTQEALANGMRESMTVPVYRTSLQTVAERISAARYELSTIQDRDRLRSVLQEDDLARESANKAIAAANALVASLRDVLGATTPTLRRVS